MKKTRHKPNNGRIKSQSSTSNESSNIYDSNDFRPRPHGQRVNYQQMYDRYLNLARDSMSDGDRVSAEFNYQYADHYLRLIRERQHYAQEKRSREKIQAEKESQVTASHENNAEKILEDEKMSGISEISPQKQSNPVVDAIVGELASSSE